MTLYRSKPQTVEAVCWSGSWPDVKDFAVGKVASASNLDGLPLLLLTGVHGAQGWIPVPVGHWIVRSVNDHSHYWAVSAEYFAEKYEVKSWDDAPGFEERLNASVERHRSVLDRLAGTATTPPSEPLCHFCSYPENMVHHKEQNAKGFHPFTPEAPSE